MQLMYAHVQVALARCLQACSVGCFAVVIETGGARAVLGQRGSEPCISVDIHEMSPWKLALICIALSSRPLQHFC